MVVARGRVPCEVCGNSCLSATAVAAKAKNNPDGRSLCIRCRADEKRERLLFDEDGTLVAVRCRHIDCANGDRWQPPENFTRGDRHREIRDGGIHSQCRACQTRARREYRHRHPQADRAYAREYRRRWRTAQSGSQHDERRNT